MTMQNVRNWRVDGNEMVLEIQDGVMGLSFVAEDTVRMRCNPGGVLLNEDTFVVLEPPEALAFDFEESATRLDLISGGVRIEIELCPLAIRIFRKDNQLVLASTHPDMLNLKNKSSIIRFQIEPGEAVYGLGQDPMAQLNHRHQERRMWQEWGGLRRSGNAGIPFLISSQGSDRGYALLLNSSWPARFAIGRAEMCENTPEFARRWAPPPWGWGVSSGETHPDELAILLDGGIMDLFIVARPGVAEALERYVGLTGRAPLPPKWALGFIQCKNRYRSQDELLYLARQFRKRGIPLDVLVIDWLWFKEFGDLEWLPKTFPDVKSAFSELEKMGVRIMQAQHPFIDTNSLKYEMFKKLGYLNGTPEGSRPTFDHSNPQAREAWWQEIARLYRDGVRGYWTDMGELEVHPEGTTHYLGSRERVHNIYSLLWTQGLYEHQRKEFGSRVFSLPRTAYAGIQRNGAAMWSNDISSTWEVLKDQVVIGQGVCLSGQQYWCTDIGGFFMDQQFSPELFIRWFEWGTFCPIFRTHGTRPNNEPWTFGPEAEQIIAGYIRLRSRLMPYIYSLARKVNENGAPIMRAMVVDFPDDPVAVKQEYQFMFGPAFLVAPVLEKGGRIRQVYLPEGEWYDFWTDQKYSGKQWIEMPAPLGRIPLFVRAGSLIPMGPVMQYADEKEIANMEVHYYPGADASFDLYEDDGLTYDYETGAYAITRLSIKQGALENALIGGDARWMPSGRKYTLVVHNPQPAQPYVEVDTNLEMDGHCSIHAVVKNTGLPVAMKATLFAPEGWTLRRGSMSQQVHVDDLAHLEWELAPCAEAMPVYHRADIAFEVLETRLSGDAGADAQEVNKFTNCVTWGSGWATRWQLIGHFDNSDGNAPDRSTWVETNPDMGQVTLDGKKFAWVRDLNWEFNPFGYVDLKSTTLGESGLQGCGYARCRIWVDEDSRGFLEVAGEGALKIWLNDQEIFQSRDVVLPKILPEDVHLKPGWNRLLVKAAFNFEKPWSGRECGFNLRLVDGEGVPLEQVLYSPA